MNGLSVSYPDGNRALSDVSFALGDGEKAALVGANGAGKSTLLMSVMGLLPIESGEISMDGVVLSRRTAPEIRRMIGLVFQNPDDQLFTTSVRDDVAFGPRNAGLAEDEVERRVDSALKRLNVARLKDRIPGRLSFGEKRMVSVASVLAMEPRALVMDEPSSFLDPRARRVLIETLRSLPHAALIATHDLDMAMRLCSRVIVLQDGTIRADGPPAEILPDKDRLEEFGL